MITKEELDKIEKDVIEIVNTFSGFSNLGSAITNAIKADFERKRKEIK
jgi:hypothetical protein